MGAMETVALLAVALLLVWGAVEIACKMVMQSGRSVLSRALDPDYEPDNDVAGSPYVEAPHPVEEPAFPDSPKKPSKVVNGEDCR